MYYIYKLLESAVIYQRRYISSLYTFSSLQLYLYTGMYIYTFMLPYHRSGVVLILYLTVDYILLLFSNYATQRGGGGVFEHSKNNSIFIRNNCFPPTNRAMKRICLLIHVVELKVLILL